MDDDLDDYKLDTTWQRNPDHVVHIPFERGRHCMGDGMRTENGWYRKEELGVGSCGIVHLETTGDGSGRRAVKSIRKSLATRLDIDYKKELAAIIIFSRAKYQSHRIFVEFYGWFENPEFIFIAMEYLPLGDLSKHILEDIKEHDLRDISLQILQGLKLMHSRGFAHRDLKPQNIFVVQKQPSWWIKIGDFGFAKRVRDCDATELRTATGTMGYEAPEIRGYVEVDEANTMSVYTMVVDMWSFGCVLYKIVTNRVPFRNGREIRRFCDGKDTFPVEPLFGKLTAHGINFLRSIIVAIPKARPTPDMALDHPWLLHNQEHIDFRLQMAPESTSKDSIQDRVRAGEYVDPYPSNRSLPVSDKDGEYPHFSLGRHRSGKSFLTTNNHLEYSLSNSKPENKYEASTESNKDLAKRTSSIHVSNSSRVSDSRLESDTSFNETSQILKSSKKMEEAESQHMLSNTVRESNTEEKQASPPHSMPREAGLGDLADFPGVHIRDEVPESLNEPIAYYSFPCLQNSPSTSNALEILDKAYKKLIRVLTENDAKACQSITLQDVVDNYRAAQSRLGKKLSYQTAQNIQGLLEKLEEQARLFRVICHGTPYLPYLWGPIQLMIMINTQRISYLSCVVFEYAKIGQIISELQYNPTGLYCGDRDQVILAQIYADILEFHQWIYKYFGRKVSTVGGIITLIFARTFNDDEEYNGIILPLKRHVEKIKALEAS